MAKKINALILLIIMIAFTETVLSQTVFRMESNFKKLEKYMFRVEEAVVKFRDQQAQTTIQLARAELEKAQIYIYNIDPPDYNQARYHMKNAKQYTDLAAKNILNQPAKVLRAYLDDLIDQAERKHAGSNNEEGIYLLKQAKKFRRISYDAFKLRQIRKARKYYRIGLFFARKCVDYDRDANLSISGQRIELEFTVQQLLTEAGQIAGDDQNLRDMVNEAEMHYQEALFEAERGNENTAVKKLKLVRRFLYRIIDRSDHDMTSPDMRLENLLYSHQAFLQSLESDYGQNMDKKTRNLFDKAQTLYAEADAALQNKRFEQANSKLTLSQQFANKVFQLQRDSKIGTAENIQFQIEETQRLIDQYQKQVNASGNESLIRMHNESQEILSRARKEGEDGKAGLAFQLNQAAIRMNGRLQRELQTGISEISVAHLEEKYNRIQNTLNRMEINQQILGRHKSTINQLRKFARRGRKFQEEGNYILADEYYNTILQQIRQYSAKWRK